MNDEELSNRILKGLPYVDFPKNLEPEAGFFAILDFTEVKGMKYKGDVINNERDLLKFFYKTSRTRFLVGQSISWPYEDELVGRVSFGLENTQIITALANMNKALYKLTIGDEYVIRKNELKNLTKILSKNLKPSDVKRLIELVEITHNHGDFINAIMKIKGGKAFKNESNNTIILN